VRTRRRSDSWYRILFGFSQVVADVLQRLGGRWTEALDWTTLEPATTELQSRDLRDRRVDRVWRARERTGTGEVWIMLEF